MCGIVGYLDRTGAVDAPIGSVLLRMLTALGDRGPDSAGVALFREPGKWTVLRVKLGETSDLEARADLVVAQLGAEGLGPVRAERLGPYLRVELPASADLNAVTAGLERLAPPGPDGIEIVSAGRCLEIVKQVGSPDDLEAAFAISTQRGTHGIGHTRLSTESRVDLSHSQPFWAHGVPDLAIVHNGHVTNYHKLRRIYEQRGVHFYTENDSEIIGIYLGLRLARGESLEEAIRASMTDLDGSYCYLAAMPGVLAFAKDPYSLKPLVVAETEDWIAVATEEVALRHALGEGFNAAEPPGRTLRVWSAHEPLLAAA
ncbi:MAG: glutamine phosphoribosylpyrophosphate amidotransferase [Armatimonadetes bacterium]|jgi:glutamine phosphoribosylpyrophosphate amidotransferase|nr:glutamine phosphoribosylpyrophosphate amidotransferase [Armatimonadota bacterium]